MMSSGSSTDRGATRRDSSFQPWHFYILLSLAGATGAVIVSRNTHPAALIMLSASIVAAGLVGAALHSAIAGFLGGGTVEKVASGRTRQFLEQEKALVLRSIKELAGHVAGGRSRDEIIQLFIKKWGSQEVLTEPIDRGFNRLAWLLPYGVGLGGIVLVGGVARSEERRVGKSVRV